METDAPLTPVSGDDLYHYLYGKLLQDRVLIKRDPNHRLGGFEEEEGTQKFLDTASPI